MSSHPPIIAAESKQNSPQTDRQQHHLKSILKKPPLSQYDANLRRCSEGSVVPFCYRPLIPSRRNSEIPSVVVQPCTPSSSSGQSSEPLSLDVSLQQIAEECDEMSSPRTSSRRLFPPLNVRPHDSKCTDSPAGGTTSALSPQRMSSSTHSNFGDSPLAAIVEKSNEDLSKDMSLEMDKECDSISSEEKSTGSNQSTTRKATNIEKENKTIRLNIKFNETDNDHPTLPAKRYTLARAPKLDLLSRIRVKFESKPDSCCCRCRLRVILPYLFCIVMLAMAVLAGVFLALGILFDQRDFLVAGSILSLTFLGLLLHQCLRRSPNPINKTGEDLSFYIGSLQASDFHHHFLRRASSDGGKSQAVSESGDSADQETSDCETEKDHSTYKTVPASAPPRLDAPRLSCIDISPHCSRLSLNPLLRRSSLMRSTRCCATERNSTGMFEIARRLSVVSGAASQPLSHGWDSMGTSDRYDRFRRTVSHPWEMSRHESMYRE